MAQLYIQQLVGEMNQYSEAQLKNIKFGNQIRNRNRQQYFRKLRKQFLQLQTVSESQCQVPLQNVIDVIGNKNYSKETIHGINTAIIKNSEQITSEMLVNICQLIQNQFVNNQNLAENALLNDYIALFSNILALSQFQKQINQIFDLNYVIEKLLDLLNRVQFHSAQLILWLIYSACRVGPASLTSLIQPHQKSLKQKFGLMHVNFIHLLCQISLHCVVDSCIIDEFLQVRIGNETRKQFCFNIVDILEKNYRNQPSVELGSKILSWIGLNLSNLHFPPEAKSEILTLLYFVIRQRLHIQQLSWLFNQRILNQIIQRAQFDSNFYNKCISTFVLCELVRTCPALLLEILVFQYSDLIQLFTDALSLMQNDIILDCLRALTRIILTWPTRKDVYRMMKQAKLQIEVEILANSPCHQIAELASSILEQYLQK